MRFCQTRHLGYRLHGILADRYHESLPKGLCLGKHERLREIIRSGQVDEVIVALPMKKEEEIMDMVKTCNQEGMRVRVIPHFFRIVRNMAVIDTLGNIPLIGIRPEPLSLLKNRIGKRAFDIGFSVGPGPSLPIPVGHSPCHQTDVERSGIFQTGTDWGKQQEI